MLKRTLAALVLVSFLALPDRVVAGLIVLENDSFMSVDNLPPVVCCGSLSGALGTASLAGDLETTFFAGSGKTGIVVPGTISAQSVIELHFTVDGGHSFELLATMLNQSSRPGATAYFADSEGNVTTFPTAGTTTRVDAFLLPSRSYTLYFALKDTPGEFSFSLTIPEPPLALLALGPASVLALRRSCTRRRPRVDRPCGT